MGEAPDLISFSPGGSSAALYYRASGRLLVLAGLRSEAPQSVEADASSLPAAPSLVAVSENAASLLLAVRAGETTGLYLLPNRTLKATPANPKLLAAAALRNDPPEVPSRAHAVAQKVGTFQSVSALRFAGGSSDALVSDGAANAAYLIQNASGAAQTTALGSAQDGLSRPVAIEAMDTRRVLVANAGSNTLTILYRDGTPAATIQCGYSTREAMSYELWPFRRIAHRARRQLPRKEPSDETRQLVLRHRNPDACGGACIRTVCAVRDCPDFTAGWLSWGAVSGAGAVHDGGL
jgi:hypothetical protein